MAPVSDGEDLVSRARSIFARLRDDQAETAAQPEVPSNGASSEPDDDVAPPMPPVEAAPPSSEVPAPPPEPPVTASSVEWSSEANDQVSADVPAEEGPVLGLPRMEVRSQLERCGRAAWKVEQREEPRPLVAVVSLAVEMLHHEEGGAVVAPDVEQRTDVRMAQRRHDARFAVEPLAELRILGQQRWKNLDGDDPIEPRIPRAIDLSHATGADLGDDFVRAEALTGAESH